jgi:hypothetical protein
MQIKFGNHKLGDDTAIFNMGTAIDCPSRRLGLCKTINMGVRCYAEKAEIQYKEPTINYRRTQEHDWKSESAAVILTEIIKRIEARRKTTLYLRFNESGDFHSQADIGKLSYIASGLRGLEQPVIAYGYTARSDLDFSTCEFLCKGSGFNKQGLNGSTRVILKDEPIPKGYILCSGSCKRCNLCKINVPHNIAFRVH